jgi:hypothetical protein
MLEHRADIQKQSFRNLFQVTSQNTALDVEDHLYLGQVNGWHDGPYPRCLWAHSHAVVARALGCGVCLHLLSTLPSVLKKEVAHKNTYHIQSLRV